MPSKKKLTLRVDDQVIERAHRYSQRHNTTISQLVSDYSGTPRRLGPSSTVLSDRPATRRYPAVGRLGRCVPRVHRPEARRVRFSLDIKETSSPTPSRSCGAPRHPPGAAVVPTQAPYPPTPARAYNRPAGA